MNSGTNFFWNKKVLETFLFKKKMDSKIFWNKKVLAELVVSSQNEIKSKKNIPKKKLFKIQKKSL